MEISAAKPSALGVVAGGFVGSDAGPVGTGVGAVTGGYFGVESGDFVATSVFSFIDGPRRFKSARYSAPSN
jgi:phage tail tape-measure protein